MSLFSALATAGKPKKKAPFAPIVASSGVGGVTMIYHRLGLLLVSLQVIWAFFPPSLPSMKGKVLVVYWWDNDDDDDDSDDGVDDDDER